MNLRCAALALLALLVPVMGRAEENTWLDRLGDSLSFTTADGTLRGHVGGTLEIDTYYTPTPRADLRFDERDLLLAPRLSLFFDGQAGDRVYAFAQTRLDRGFDPADKSMRLRLDELAIRLHLGEERRVSLQAGKFATVVGAWSARHLAWENPFVTAPLTHEGLTPMWDRRATVSIPQVLRRAHIEPESGGAGVAADKHQRIPIIWGPAYASGAAVVGALGRLDFAVELKNAAPSSRPGSWGLTDRPWGSPTVGGRVGFRPNVMWDLGLSGASGSYLTREAIATAPADTGASDHRQNLVGIDIRYAHRHFQFWAEAYVSRFHAPGVEHLDTLAWYLEAKYKFTPRFAGAVRWNHQLYSHVDHPGGGRVRWGRGTTRLDLVVIRRLTHQCQIKVQYSPQHEYPAPDTLSHAVALQFVARF